MGSQKPNGTNDGGNSNGTVAVKQLPKKWTERRSAGRIFLGAGFVLAIISLAMTIGISHRSGQRLEAASRAVTNTREVLEKVESIMAQLSEVESSARSFAISGKQSQLGPFYTAMETVPTQVSDLKVLLQNDPASLRSLNEIEPVIAKHLKVMKDMVELSDKILFRRSGQRNLTDEGSKLMEQIRTAFTALEKDQRALLAREQTAVAAKADNVTKISL